MPIRTLSAAGLIVAALLQVGCGGPPRFSPGEYVPPTSAAPALHAVPVVYDPRLTPQPLTMAQMQEILADAQPACPPGQQIWFILVRHNVELPGPKDNPQDKRWHYAAIVYYTPQTQTARLRKGLCLYLASADPELASVMQALGAHPEGLLPWWQVSAETDPFTQQLDVPTWPLMPFAAPRDLSDEEVVRIVDFVRTGPRAPAPANGGLLVVDRFDATEPILSITNQDGLIRVQSGSIQAPLAGQGQILILKKADTGYQVVELLEWVS